MVGFARGRFRQNEEKEISIQEPFRPLGLCPAAAFVRLNGKKSASRRTRLALLNLLNAAA
jgi:hypothetical protein